MGGATLISPSDDDVIDTQAPKDVTVRIKEYRTETVNGKTEKRSRTVECKCSKGNLIKSADYFAAHWRYDRNKDHIFFDGETHLSMEVWLGAFHGNVPDRLLGISRTELWHIIDAGERYQFPLSPLLKEFFAAWYAKNVQLLSKEIASELALPCFIFDHAEGFMQVTHSLIYNTPGHITEQRPLRIKYKHIHLAPPEFVGPMNHSRGRLKTILHTKLWGPARKLHNENVACSCRKATEFDYLDDLIEREVFPIDDYANKTSINELLNRLKGFSYKPAARGCHYCSIDWTHIVNNAIVTTKGYNQGLCLDCMARSRTRDDDAEYWRKCGDLNGRWDRGCRVDHGEPTWYVSWLGRTEHRQMLLNTKYEKKRNGDVDSDLFDD